MIISKEIALDLWNNLFGKLTETHDAFGRLISKTQYESDYEDDMKAWTVVYVQPLNQNGSTHISNIIPMHRESAEFFRLRTSGTMLGKYKMGRSYADADFNFEVEVIDRDAAGGEIGRLKTCFRSLQHSWSYSDWIYAYYNCDDALWFEIILKGVKKSFFPTKNSLRKVFSDHKLWNTRTDITETIRVMVEEETAELELKSKKG